MVGAVMVAEAPVAVCPLINRFVDVGSTVPSVLKSKLLVVPVKSPTSVLAEVMAAAIEVGTVMVNTLPLMPADTPATVSRVLHSNAHPFQKLSNPDGRLSAR
jgi:hypothetical protein